MKLYTRTGDEGKTSVIGGGRVAKDDLRVEAYGTIDELGACVGQAVVSLRQTAKATLGDAEATAALDALADRLVVIQHELFDCGSDLCYASPEASKMKVSAEMAARLEAWIDEYEAKSPPIERFILSGGSESAALLHICRTVCRRAERRIVSLAAEQLTPGEVVKYVNRLSDFFFAAARAANAALGVADVEYERSAKVFRLYGL